MSDNKFVAEKKFQSYILHSNATCHERDCSSWAAKFRPALERACERKVIFLLWPRWHAIHLLACEHRSLISLEARWFLEIADQDSLEPTSRGKHCVCHQKTQRTLGLEIISGCLSRDCLHGQTLLPKLLPRTGFQTPPLFVFGSK